MTKTTTMIALLITLLTAAGGSALAGQSSDDGAESAERHRLHRPGERGFLSERATEFLALDEEQSRQLKNILEAAKPEFDALRERGRSHRQALMALDPDDAGYGAALQNLSVESGRVATDLTLLHGRVRGEVNALLTPAQKALLAERMSQFAERGRRRPSLLQNQ